jgi:hypothetical protein
VAAPPAARLATAKTTDNDRWHLTWARPDHLPDRAIMVCGLCVQVDQWQPGYYWLTLQPREECPFCMQLARELFIRDHDLADRRRLEERPV